MSTFKEGDEVVVSIHGHRYDGRTAVVVEAVSNSLSNRCAVKIMDVSGWPLFLESELRHLQPQEKEIA